MEAGALPANGFKDVQNGFLVQAGQSAHGSDANAFAKQLNHLMQFGGFDPYAFQWLCLGKSLAATHTAKAANNTVSVLKFGEVFGFPGAAMAFQLAFLGRPS
jgi:hypothetical protein